VTSWCTVLRGRGRVRLRVIDGLETFKARRRKSGSVNRKGFGYVVLTIRFLTIKYTAIMRIKTAAYDDNHIIA
jgi:hypothetical protein